MQFPYALSIVTLVFLLAAPGPARAVPPYQSALMEDRVERLEQELDYVRKQLYRANERAAAAGQGRGYAPGAAERPATAADIGARLGVLEEQIAGLRGMIEETQHQTGQVVQRMELLGKDVEYRLSALEKNASSLADAEATGEPSSSAIAPASVTPDTIAPATIVPPQTLSPSAPPPPARYQPQENPAPASATPPASPRELYNQGFALMNQAQHARAGETFEAFLQHYPNDPLAGNVYYWLGETWYVREDYVKAADAFRRGFEAMPDGVKAPDNLLKLAKSLDILGKSEQGCVVLKQLLVKFAGGAASVLQKAKEERARMKCPE